MLSILYSIGVGTGVLPWNPYLMGLGFLLDTFIVITVVANTMNTSVDIEE